MKQMPIFDDQDHPDSELLDDGGPYNVKEYPQREIFAFGRYIKCQILNWDAGPPPPFLICHPLDPTYRQEFLATRGMGTWMQVDLRHALWLIANSKEHSLVAVGTGSKT
jgi:hypothetical protein